MLFELVTAHDSVGDGHGGGLGRAATGQRTITRLTRRDGPGDGHALCKTTACSGAAAQAQAVGQAKQGAAGRAQAQGVGCALGAVHGERHATAHHNT